MGNEVFFNPTVSFMESTLPFWNHLNDFEKKVLSLEAVEKHFYKNTLLRHSEGECTGLVIVRKGQLRAFITSDEGKEITLYRLLTNDICIMSASCMFKDLTFEVNFEFETEGDVVIIPTHTYELLNNQNVDVKSFTLTMVSSRMSDVMWVLQQFVFSNVGHRLANALLEQSILNETSALDVTHDFLARDLGTAREVVTRLLKQLQLDGIVSLSRSKIEIVDMKALKKLAT